MPNIARSEPNSLESIGVTRRGFIKSTAAAAALAAPYYVPASVFGANSPSNRINVGCIGVGNQGYPNLLRFLNADGCQVVAVCDVNRGSYGYRDPKDLRGCEPAKQAAEEFYAKLSGAGTYKGCAAYNDFRELLARDDIDAVMIASPDHWHEAMTIAACESGKDVYCEKPLGLTIGGQQKMVAAVRKHKRILQTGTHHRSDPIVAQACELVKSGAIGDVKRVLCHVARNNVIGPGPGWQPMPVPDGFDYDLWLGPAPEAPYHKDRCLYNFRFNYDYSGGQVTNFGVHTIDMAQRSLGTDLTGPVEVKYEYADYLPEGSLFNTAINTFFRCRYANGTVLECFTSEPSARVIWEGTEGMARVDAGGVDFFITPSKLWPREMANQQKLGSSEAHVKNFLDCVKSREEPIAPVEVGHRSSSIPHLGNIAIRLQTKLTWDPDAEKFTGKGSDEANALLNRPGRGEWERSVS